MSSGINSVQQRLKLLPRLIVECSTEATAYGRCVAVKDSVKPNDCFSEFNVLKNCIASKVKKVHR